MAQTKTNNFSLAYAIEDSLAILTSTEWKLLQPNDITTWGSVITTVPRDPISNRRQRNKGLTTDLDSSVEFEHDLTLEAFIDFAEAFVFANFKGAEVKVPTAVTALDSYTVPVGAILPAATLVYGRAFSTSDNNGLKEVDTGATATNVPVVETLVAETPSATQNVTLEVCGVRGASGDLTLTVTGTTGVLASTILDLSSLDLELGQLIHVGGLTTTNQFDNGTGYARITSIATNAIGLDKLSATLLTDTGTGKSVDLLFGRFLKNVAVTDTDYLERSFHFEGDFVGQAKRFEYSKGNVPNSMAIAGPLTDKAVVTFSFVGTDTDVPTATRLTGADTPILPVQTGGYSTSGNILRLRVQKIDETGVATDFKDWTLTLNNGATAEKVQAQLGAKYINTSNFEVNLESQVLFTDDEVPNAVRNNTTLTMDILLKSDDGALGFDLPSMTLGDGAREFPRNETVLANLTGEAFEDITLGTSIGISIFPVVPS